VRLHNTPHNLWFQTLRELQELIIRGESTEDLGILSKQHQANPMSRIRKTYNYIEVIN